MGEAIAVGGINKGTTGMPVGLFSIKIGQSILICDMLSISNFYAEGSF